MGPLQIDPYSGHVTVENVGTWNPDNATPYRPLQQIRPQVFGASVTERDSFAPSFSVKADGRRYVGLTANRSKASLDAAFSSPGVHAIAGHVAGHGPLAGRFVTATVEVTDAR